MTTDTHKGWLIEQNWLGQWEATHPDYDPTPMHLYDPPGDNRSVTAGSRDEVIEEIDFWIDENELPPAPAASSTHDVAQGRDVVTGGTPDAN